MAHTTRPVLASSDRKLAQPLVLQYRRRSAWARRRSRRMELARPTTAVVVDRVIMVVLRYFLAALAVPPRTSASRPLVRSTAAHCAGAVVDSLPGRRGGAEWCSGALAR